ncbi:MAG: M48 family metalloprotease [Candidatus Hodarchaeales archaeon]|jgi:Zn-dependent protease with chaperone function
MIRGFDQSLGVKLPLSDIFFIFLYVLVFPLFAGLSIILISVLIGEEISIFIILNLVCAFFFLISLILYFNSYRRLNTLVLEVGFYHFQPSRREIAIHLIQQVYYVIGSGFVLAIILRLFIVETLELWNLLGISLLLSLVVQLFFLIRSIRSKKELLSTAQESLDQDIFEYLKINYSESELIAEYRFADVQIPSLFLSAGVMSFGWKKNICIISRYFKWKLTDEELIAVILHEIGHIANNHITKSYILGGTEFFLRIMRIFCILTGLVLLTQKQFFTLNYHFLFFYLLLILLVFLSSTFLTFFFRYRIFLAEIRADSFSARIVGNTILADTLRKLPSTIPSPIGYNQSSFLGFRVAILRHQAKIEGL